MSEQQNQVKNELASVNKNEPKPKYETPQIKVLTEQEVLSAFQVTAAGTTMWWG